MRPARRLAGPASPRLRPAERIYFPELDGLRFIAFMMVYLFHGGVPQGIVARLIGSRAAAALRENGGFGVQLFFILSGYLIATLLLREEARYGRIDLRAFWVRRILRIWPLYYLILVIGFGLIPALEGQLRTPQLPQHAAHPSRSVSGDSWATGRWPWSAPCPTGSAFSGACASKSSFIWSCRS